MTGQIKVARRSIHRLPRALCSSMITDTEELIIRSRLVEDIVAATQNVFSRGNTPDDPRRSYGRRCICQHSHTCTYRDRTIAVHRNKYSCFLEIGLISNLEINWINRIIVGF